MKGLGASAAGAIALGSDYGFTREAEAIAPLIGVGAIGASAALGWALREFEVIGSDAPPEGLTADALRNEVDKTLRKRKSTNASTIVDNQNILDGVEHTAYTDAKIAAIEELNAGSTESAVLDAASTAIDAYETTVRKNLLKTWNESARELANVASTLGAHPDTNKNYIKCYHTESSGLATYFPEVRDKTDYTLPDGTSFTIKEVGAVDDGSWPQWWSPVGYDANWDPMPSDWWFHNTATGLEYLRYSDWNGIWTAMDIAFQNVRNGMSTWVTNVYGQVQSGDIEISDLVTPRERAAMMSSEEGIAQAIADLAALNISVDVEREATITFPDTGATLRGTFGLTDESDGPIEAGKTYDPTTFSGDVYFTTDTSLLEGDWSAYETGVDGGNITLTSEPYEGTAVEVTTAANETVAVNATDWTATGNGTWYYDAADDLETTITEVTDARYRANTTETNMETLNLEATFTVNKFENTQTGEEADSATFEKSEPQTDSNYITQEEWNSLEQQNQELIEKYEASQNNGGGLDLGALDMFGLPGEIVGVAIAAIVGFLALSD